MHLLCHLDSPSVASLPYLGLQETGRTGILQDLWQLQGFLPGVLFSLCALPHLEGSLTGQQASRSPVLRIHNNPQETQTILPTTAWQSRNDLTEMISEQASRTG